MPHGKWTKANFKKHHKEHPEIYDKFCKFAKQAARVKAYYSAKAIFHRIRWETQIEEKKSEFKIDDGWISHYARKFMEDFPKYDGFFQIRHRENSYHK